MITYVQHVKNIRRKNRRSYSVVIIMNATIPNQYSQCSVYQSQGQCRCHPYRFSPPIVYPLSSSKSFLQRKLDIDAKRTQMFSVPVGHDNPVPRVRMCPLSNCFLFAQMHPTLKPKTTLVLAWMITDWSPQFATTVATCRGHGSQVCPVQNAERCSPKLVQSNQLQPLPSRFHQRPSVPVVISRKARH